MDDAAAAAAAAREAEAAWADADTDDDKRRPQDDQPQTPPAKNDEDDERTPHDNNTTILTKSQQMHAIHARFSEPQKIAYAGLCALLSARPQATAAATTLTTTTRSRTAWDAWAKALMDRVCAALELSDAERAMVDGLAGHGVRPEDLARGLLEDNIIADDQGGVGSEADVRFTVLTHLFILGVLDGTYDSRCRLLLRKFSALLGVAEVEVVRLERCVASRLRVTEGFGGVRGDAVVVEGRNRGERTRRILTLGLATIAGGAVVGVTAGLAAPLIATGIGAALTMFGVSGGIGVGAFMGGTTGIALIATGGALTGGGMSGFKMLRRTRGISQFEFIAIEDAVLKIEANRTRRAEERRKRRERRGRWTELSGRTSIDNFKNVTSLALPSVSLDGDDAASNKSGRESERSRVVSEADDIGTLRHGSAMSSTISIPDLSIVGVCGQRTNPVIDSIALNDTDVLWENESAFSEGTDPDVDVAAFQRDNRISVSTIGTNFTDFGSEDGSHQQQGPPAFLLPSPEPPPSTTSVAEDDDERNSKLAAAKQTNVLITVAGWVSSRDSEDEFTLPFSTIERGDDSHGDQYALVWETRALIALGSAMKMLVAEVTTFLIQQGIQTFLLPVLMAGLTGPLWMLKFASWLDNPWAVGLSKAKKAGLVLADTLMANVQSGRPVTLVGFSLGARVIFHCLLELANRGGYGIVEEAYLFGCPVIATAKEWNLIASVVAGRLVNGYLTNDWILGVLYRTSSAASYRDVAGLRPVEVGGVENVCLDGVIKGHLEYRSFMPVILQHVGFRVTGVVFEDPEEEEDDEEQSRKLSPEKSGGGVASADGTDVTTAGPMTVTESAAVAGIDLKGAEEGKNVADVILVDGVGGSAAAPPPALTAGSNRSSIIGWFSSRGKRTVSSGTATPAPPATVKKSTSMPGSLAKVSKSLQKAVVESLKEEEEMEKERVEQIMESYWTPREVPSTLPPLVITESAIASKEDQCEQTDDVPRDSAVAMSAAPVATFERENSSGDLGESIEASARTSVVAETAVLETHPVPLKSMDSQSTVSDMHDTRGDLPSNRWDGYQGPVPLSSNSSSSDIAAGVNLEYAMGALPGAVMGKTNGDGVRSRGLKKEWETDPSVLGGDVAELSGLLQRTHSDTSTGEIS